jgi:MoaA/NifB/PqqE/SkfB family radical SAM enzyme
MTNERDMTRPDTLCAYPWTHLFVSNAGRQLPCCFAQSNVEEVRRVEPIDAAASDLDALWSSTQIRELRLQMIRGERPALCSGCFAAEDSGCRSPRQDANEVHPPEEIARLVESTSSDGAVASAFRSIDLRLGNQCNLRCRMCSPHSARQLIPEWSRTGDPEMVALANESAQQRTWVKTRGVWDSLLASAGDVESIHFAGGEPALIDEHHDFLRKLVATGRAPRVRLSYSTNLTRILPDLETYLDHFKAIHMIGSLDGYAEVNGYIRFPAKWDVLVRNLEALDALASRSPALSLDLHTTVQAYNLTRITELLQFLEDSHLRNVPAVPAWTPVTFPPYFNPRVLLPELKHLARDRYVAFRTRPRSSRTPLEEQRLDELEHILDLAIAESSSRDTAAFVAMTQFFDRERRENVTDVIPELGGMFTPPSPALPAAL